MSKIERDLNSWQRSEAYWFLSTLFADQMDIKAVTRMSAVATDQSGDDELAGEIFKAFRDTRSLETLTLNLAQEHTRLFCGISEEYGPPPPYESLWREGQLMGESTVQVAKAYLEAGYKSEGRFAPLDHVVEELRFMASLCNAEHEAETAKDNSLAAQLREKQYRFLTEHLNSWIGHYCRSISEISSEALYRSLAHVTAAVVADDTENLKEAMS